MIVRHGDTEGFVPDEIPRIDAACPVAWREWMADDPGHLSSNEWTARLMGEARQFAPILDMGRNVVGAMSGKGAESTVAKAPPSLKPRTVPSTTPPAFSASPAPRLI